MVFLFGWKHSIVGPILFCTHKSKTGGALCYDSLVRKERVAAEGGALKRRLDAAVFVKFITGAEKANLSGLAHE